ncbi:cysteine desulfurase [Verrucomicrobia bacterium]|nr:cysteine desulfurase [Verrucomicrobiota bacterium]MDB4796837.1 cysteine desulfurase [bacterium]
MYLDHSATTPLDSAVLDAMMPFLNEHHGNPGSPHRAGRIARKAVERAREQVAQLIGAEPREILFSGSGTEANNTAIGGLQAQPEKDRTVVYSSAFEHHSVLEAVRHINPTTTPNEAFLSVTDQGFIDTEPLISFLRNKPRLVSVMLANNEIGTIQPLEAIGQICQEHSTLLHTDAVQAAGKIPIDVSVLSVDALTISAHKIHGPKGVGALFIRHGGRLNPLIRGGAQESGLRAGTENVANIVGFGHACQLASEKIGSPWESTRRLRDELETELQRVIPNIWINGSTQERLPHITNIAFEGLEGEAVMMALDAEQIAVGTGSACSSGSLDPSHVLLAMGQSHKQAHAAIRISLSQGTTRRETATLIKVLPPIIERLRQER